MFLPDTNVLSELRKAGDGYQVDRWSFIPGAVALEPVMAFEFKLLKKNGLVGSHGFLGGLVSYSS